MLPHSHGRGHRFDPCSAHHKKAPLHGEFFLWADRVRTVRTAKQKQAKTPVSVCKVLILLMNEAFLSQTRANLKNQEKIPVVPTIKKLPFTGSFFMGGQGRTGRTAKPKRRSFAPDVKTHLNLDSLDRQNIRERAVSVGDGDAT